MSLQFIIGRGGSGKTAYCLESMRSKLFAEPEGAPLVLILPEHMTFKVEKELANTPDLHGFTRAYVFGFRRLAQRVLLETGGAIYPSITEIGKRLLLSRVLSDNLDTLHTLGRAARQRNFTDSLARMIEEFKSYGVAAETLEQAAASMPDSALKEKLMDLALIYQGFNRGMEGHYTDAEDVLEVMEQKIADSSILRDAEVWIDGFVFFNPQEMNILREILLTAKCVKITLSLEHVDSLEHTVDTSLFHRQWKTLQQVRRMAEDLDMKVDVVELPSPKRFATANLGHIEANLFKYPIKPFADPGGTAIVEAANRRIEVEGVAVDILRLCREEHYKWRDIGILVRDSSAYEDVLQAVLQDYQIPFFSDSKRQTIHHPLAELLRSALEALHGWKYEPLFRCFKTDFFPVTRSQIDLLENYVLEFGIRGNRWLLEEDWSYHKRLSLDEDSEISDENAERLAQINQIRRQVMLPLAKFAQQIKKAATVCERTTALYQLFTDLAVPETLENWAKAAEKQGDLAEARQHQQLWDDIVQLFDQLVETCGADVMSADVYEQTINDGLDGLMISLIPPGLDYVTIAPFDQNSLDNTKAIYIVGANEGVMPRRGKTEGLLTDGERAELASLGLELSQGVGADNFAEKYLLYSAFTRSTEYLWVSYPLADQEGAGLNPSSLVQRLRELLPLVKLQSLPLEPLPGSEYWSIAQPRQAVAKLAGALRAYRKNGFLSPIWQDVYNWALTDEAMQPVLAMVTAGLFDLRQAEALPTDVAKLLFTKNKYLRGSVTRFERFRACPFQHFAQYGLKLKERAEFSFAAPDLGNFLHASLKAFGERMKAEGRNWSDVKEGEYQNICGEIVADLAPKLQNEILLSSAKYQHLLGRIRRTVERAVKRLMAFDYVSCFKPIGFEKAFGHGFDALPPLTYSLEDGYQIEITGQIDRIDCMEAETRKYFLVIDYKSGNAYLNLLEVYYGLKLQLLTYLLVAQNAAQKLVGGKTIPAGILYYFLKNPVVSAKYRLSEKETEAELTKMLKMPGWILADSEIIRQIDSSFNFIKVSLKTDGEIKQTGKNNVKSEAEFMALLGFVDSILSDTGRQILSGDVSISPFALDNKEACTFCPYRSFCQFDRMIPGHEYRQLKKLENEAVMESITEEAAIWHGPKHN